MCPKGTLLVTYLRALCNLEQKKQASVPSLFRVLNFVILAGRTSQLIIQSIILSHVQNQNTFSSSARVPSEF